MHALFVYLPPDDKQFTSLLTLESPNGYCHVELGVDVQDIELIVLHENKISTAVALIHS